MFEKEEAEEKLSEEEYKLAEEVIKPIYHNAIKNDYSFAKYGVECYLAGYNKANEWQTGIPQKKWEIFARTTANCNLLATYFDGAWRNVWNGGIIDFDKITMWRYTGFKNNGEEIDFKELSE